MLFRMFDMILKTLFDCIRLATWNAFEWLCIWNRNWKFMLTMLTYLNERLAYVDGDFLVAKILFYNMYIRIYDILIYSYIQVTEIKVTFANVEQVQLLY